MLVLCHHVLQHYGMCADLLVASAVQVLIHVVSALFDINPSMSTHMLVHLWKKCVAVLLEVLDLLRAHPEVVLDEAHEVRRRLAGSLPVA